MYKRWPLQKWLELSLKEDDSKQSAKYQVPLQLHVKGHNLSKMTQRTAHHPLGFVPGNHIIVLFGASVHQGWRPHALREKSQVPPRPWSGQLGLGRSQDRLGVTVPHPKQATAQNAQAHRQPDWCGPHTLPQFPCCYTEGAKCFFQKQYSTIPCFLTVMIILISY